MKKTIRLFLFILSVLAINCSSSGGGGSLPPYTETNEAVIEAETIVLVSCPIGFPGGPTDDTFKTVRNSYRISKTEVTWGLWRTVRDWAVDKGYVFVNQGECGRAGTSDKQPVTMVSWLDCVVWCNAATEWYNEKKGMNIACVYTFNGAIVRNASQSGLDVDGAIIQTAGAKGFRLPTSTEWELAARWRNDSTNTVANYSSPWFTTGLSASGATSSNNTDAAAVAVFNTSSTANVGSKTANALGLFDMSGNVSELCFDSYSGSNRIIRGDYFTSSSLFIGRETYVLPKESGNTMGFRFVRN